MAWFDDLNSASFQSQGGFQSGQRPGSIEALKMELEAEQKKKEAENPKGKGNFLTSLIPSGAGIAGAAGGAAIGTAFMPGLGTIAGALIGGAFGGGAGKVAENAVEGEQNLGKGVGEEALINGIMGAGPLRLIKGGVDVARGLKAGTGLAEAVTQAGTKAVSGSIKGAVGKKLTEASDNLAVKNFRLTPAQLNNYKSKFGEDASQIIKKYKLIGKDAEAISENAIKPLQGEFDAISKNIPSLPTADVLRSFKSKYEPLLKSAVEDNQAIGQQLKNQADTLAKKFGAEIPSSELAAVRKEFDGLVSYADKAANPARHSVNKLSADAVRTALQQSADKAGIRASNGMTFKEVGHELSKLRQLTDNIAKQEQLGRGSLPFGIGNTPGAIIGSAGGVPGALVGAAGTAIMNSPTGRTAIASSAEKLGGKLAGSAAKTNPFSIGSTAGRILPAGMASGLASELTQPSFVNSASPAQSTTTPTNIPMSSNMDSSYNTGDQMSIPQSQNPYPQENLMYDIQRDPQNADKYISYFKGLQEVFGAKAQKPLSSTATKDVSNANIGLQALDQIEQQLGSDPGIQQRQGISGSFNPLGLVSGALGTGEYENARSQARDVIARIRTGAALTADEAKAFDKFLPQPGDDQATIHSKLSYLRNQFSAIAGQQGGGPLEDALMGAQGGY